MREGKVPKSELVHRQQVMSIKVSTIPQIPLLDDIYPLLNSAICAFAQSWRPLKFAKSLDDLFIE